jgi:hypothetical protein
MKSKQYQRVKDLLHKYTIIQPNNSQVFCLMAQILHDTNDIDQAKSWLVLIPKVFFFPRLSFLQVFTSIKYSSNRWTFTSTNR